MTKKKIVLLAFLAATLFLIAACGQEKQKAQQTNCKNIPTKINRKPDRVTQILNKMSLNEKIGQLYVAHSTGNFKQMKADLKNYQLGGITLYAPDYQNRTKPQFLRQMKGYQAASKHGLFIATDQEGGTVSRLNLNPKICKRSFPSPQEINQRHGLVGIKKEDIAVAHLLKSNDLNMNFAPVADVAENHSSFIYARTLGKNYRETGTYIKTAVQAFQSQKIAATLKHFPGYGDANDTHTGFAASNKALAAYQKEDLLPFKEGIKAGADCVMVSHIVIKSLDPNLPASLSPAAHRLLRKKLHFKNLIITDDLQMGAIKEYAQNHHVNADVLALKAGNDLLLGGDYRTGIPAIKAAVKRGQISKGQINQAVKRILELKAKLGILK